MTYCHDKEQHDRSTEDLQERIRGLEVALQTAIGVKNVERNYQKALDALQNEADSQLEIARRGLSYILHGAKDAVDMYAAANKAMALLQTPPIIVKAKST